MEEIMQAVGILQAGDREEARTKLLDLWDKWAGKDGALERCTIAHFLADTEGETGHELEWDLRALEAATGSRKTEDRPPLQQTMIGFLPSLHLNVGDAYRRLGDEERAGSHAKIGLRHVQALNDDAYGRTIHEGLERLLARLDASS